MVVDDEFAHRYIVEVERLVDELAKSGFASSRCACDQYIWYLSGMGVLHLHCWTIIIISIVKMANKNIKARATELYKVPSYSASFCFIAPTNDQSVMLFLLHSWIWNSISDSATSLFFWRGGPTSISSFFIEEALHKEISSTSALSHKYQYCLRAWISFVTTLPLTYSWQHFLFSAPLSVS